MIIRNGMYIEKRIRSRARQLLCAAMLLLIVAMLAGCGYGGDSRFSGWWRLDGIGHLNEGRILFSFNEERFTLSLDKDSMRDEAIQEFLSESSREIIREHNWRPPGGISLPDARLIEESLGVGGTYSTNDDGVIEFVLSDGRILLGDFSITQNTLTISFRSNPGTIFQLTRD